MKKSLIIVGFIYIASTGHIAAGFMDYINDFFNFFSFSTSSQTFETSNAPAKKIEYTEKKKYEETFTYDTYHQIQVSYPFKENGQISLENFNGDVYVQTSNIVDKINIEVILEPHVLRAPITTTMTVDPTLGDARIKTIAHKQSINVAAVFNITIPHNTDNLYIETANGKIVVADIKGAVKLHTSNGSVTVSRIIGSTKIQTSNGTINAEHITGAIDFNTSNGKIIASGINAEDRLSIRSSNGSLDITLDSIKQIKEAEIKTSNGTVTVHLPKSLGATVTGTTSNGTIQGNIWKEVKQKFGGNNAEVTLGDGSLRLELGTSNSSINANFGK